MGKATDNMTIQNRVVELRHVRGRDLLRNPRNWREHPKAQQDAMKGVLESVGFAGAVLARETPEGLVLIDGHLRAATLPNMAIPVLIIDVTEEEADRILATYDPLSAMAQPDQDVLLALLQDVSFESKAVNEMLEALANGETQPMPDRTGLTDPDDVPPIPETPYVNYGDLWQLGDHRVLCGDATRTEDIETLMGQSRADLMWTDPPYGVDYVGKTAAALRMQNDRATGLIGLLRATFVGAPLIESAPVYVMAPPGALWATVYEAFISVGWRFHQGLVWVKDSMVLGHSDYHFRHENILYGFTEGYGRPGRGKHEGTRWGGDHSQTSVFEIGRSKRSTEHPTIKPVALVQSMVANSSKQAGMIYDPFLGSGTTLMACEHLYRSCYGMEIEPRYVQVVIERWQDYTGEKAMLLANHATPTVKS